MVRSVLFFIGVALLYGTITPAHAAQSCQEFCMQNRCAHGVISQAACMNRCVPICEQKRSKGR